MIRTTIISIHIDASVLRRPYSSSSETHDEASDAIPNAQVTVVISKDIPSNKAQAPVQPTIQFPSGNQLHDILKKLKPASPPFSALTKSLITAMTFGTSTASDEQSFFSLKKNYLHSTMSQKQLDNLVLLNIERDLSSHL